jgi:hypothetical protein
MRVLRFVGPGDDADHLIVETTDGGEQFLLELDGAIRAAVGPDLPRPASTEPQPEAVPEIAPDTAISPREIQMRVRAGAQPQQLADDHAMTLDKVLRFAGPVLAERTRISDEARRAKARRSTTEGQIVVFGEAVEERFAAHGIDPATIAWDAYRRDDGQWIVTASWVGGATERVAEWVFHLAGRTVTPLDDTAADLLSDRPIRSSSPSEEPARPSLVAAPPLAPGVVAFPPMPDADTGPIPTAAELDEVYDQDSNRDSNRDTRDRDARRRVAAGGVGGDTDDDFHAPPLPLRLADATQVETDGGLIPASPTARTGRLPKVTNLGVASREDETDEERAARARIPSWDDILLGVRRKSD